MHALRLPLLLQRLNEIVSGAGRRAVLEVEDGEVLPQREFVQYDREAEELDAHGVRILLRLSKALLPMCRRQHALHL